MNLLEDITGQYRHQEIDEQTGFGNEFWLKIDKNDDGKLKFTFEMATVGQFGKIGETWKGKGISRGDHLALIIEEQINWVENSNEKQRVESKDETLNTLPIELYPHFDKVAIFHKKLDKIITLQKIDN